VVVEGERRRPLESPDVERGLMDREGEKVFVR
jgi:hypothetical protein